MPPRITKHRRPLRRLFGFLADPGAAAVKAFIAAIDAEAVDQQKCISTIKGGRGGEDVTGFDAIQHFHDLPAKLLAVPGRGAPEGVG